MKASGGEPWWVSFIYAILICPIAKFYELVKFNGVNEYFAGVNYSFLLVFVSMWEIYFYSYFSSGFHLFVFSREYSQMVMTIYTNKYFLLLCQAYLILNLVFVRTFFMFVIIQVSNNPFRWWKEQLPSKCVCWWWKNRDKNPYVCAHFLPP